MAVLSRAGCNSGPCHGNQNGKNGFKLSLRGEDADFDRLALTRDTLGRRTDPLRPEQSLLLAKAVGAVPHEGGKRFDRGSTEYEILYRWIAAGLPNDPADAPVLKRLEAGPISRVLIEPEETVGLQVRALFSNGSIRDVTRLAVYEASNLVAQVGPDGVVRRRQSGETTILIRYLNQQTAVRLAFVPARPDFIWSNPPEHNLVDHHLFAKLRVLRINPSALAPDSVFLRRVFLDTLGLLPSAEETRRFLADPRSDKRERLIDQLLQRPEFADFWALKWSDLLRNEEKALDQKGVQLFHGWIRQCIQDGKPLNELARELIASRGSTYSFPAANYYRALRDPHARAEATAQVFLGVRLQCAKCHNHPFDRWTQNDYHSLAAFFDRVQYRVVENARRDRLDKHEFKGEQIVWLAREGETTHPRTGEILRPRLLGADTPVLPPEADRLQLLADWVARPDNPFFARTQVNRVWQHLFGRGLVDPNDDFRASNPPVNPELLEALTRDFVAHKFDLRQLVRRLLTSRTYQLSAIPNDSNRDDDSNFSHALVRQLQAEQLLDALSQVTGAPLDLPGMVPGMRAGQLPGVGVGRERGNKASEEEKFLLAFGKPVRSLSCECERAEDSTLNQAFLLISGDLFHRLLTRPNNRLAQLLASSKPDAMLIDELFLSALCRAATEKERHLVLQRLAGSANRRAVLEDLTWALVNSKEFLLRQ